MLQLSERIKNIRAAAGISQSEFAEMAGVSLASQQNYESGKRTPDAEYLRNLHLRGVDTQYIITGESEKNVVRAGLVSIPHMAATGSMGNGISFFVDIGVKELKGDGIYIFELEKELFIKRLQRYPGGKIKMISDNPIYDSIMIGEGDYFRVIGKIIGICQIRKV